ncbi:hypothetical protein [Streptomyces sp. NEAU-S77]|uniref:hypothetical protein n=1 Tax=Streptomyces sp. NEAU-S77 TaxID=3411033 RepID=UPI003BA07627
MVPAPAGLAPVRHHGGRRRGSGISRGWSGRGIAEPDPIDATRLENELVAMLTRYLTLG